MILVRLSKVALVAGLALFSLLVAYGNVSDYDANWQFIHHVMSMDTIDRVEHRGWRAINTEEVQRTAYALLILFQALTAFAYCVSAALMVRALTRSKAAFLRAKSSAAVGVALAFGVWFVAFITVGGEWFSMGRSLEWNGLAEAFRFSMISLVVAIYVMQDTDGERAQHL